MDEQIEDEIWRDIPEFPRYQVSNQGRIISTKTDRLVAISVTTHGHAKVNLADEQGRQRSRSVAKIVATAFVSAPNYQCDQVLVLDGDYLNVRASNLVWRPSWFVWKYVRQHKVGMFPYYQLFPVMNTTTGAIYETIVEACLREGLLFHDVWMSTINGAPVFPMWDAFCKT